MNTIPGTNQQWLNFVNLYYDCAISHTQEHLKKIKISDGPYWNFQIDEEVLIQDVAFDALQQAFLKYNPARGVPVSGFIKVIAHNELVDKLKKIENSIGYASEIDPSKEYDYNIRSMVSLIPKEVMSHLEEALKEAIKQLQPIEQGILEFYLDNPKTFVERSVEEFGLTPNMVSVRKNRAIAKLPALISVSAEEYYNSFEEMPLTMGYLQTNVSKPAAPKYTNAICPEFDLGATAKMLCNAIRAEMR